MRAVPPPQERRAEPDGAAGCRCDGATLRAPCGGVHGDVSPVIPCRLQRRVQLRGERQLCAAVVDPGGSPCVVVCVRAHHGSHGRGLVPGDRSPRTPSSVASTPKPRGQGHGAMARPSRLEAGAAVCTFQGQRCTAVGGADDVGSTNCQLCCRRHNRQRVCLHAQVKAGRLCRGAVRRWRRAVRYGRGVAMGAAVRS